MNTEKYKQKTDGELALSAGVDHDAFSEIIDRYEGSLARYMKRIAFLSKEDTEDLLQNVFIKVYRNINDFDTSLKFSSWIYRITHNETVDFLRKKSVRPKVSISEESDLALEHFADSTDIIGQANIRYDAKIVREALARIGPKYEQVLILYFMENKTYDEIGDIIEHPKNTVGTLINRAKKNLRIELEKIGRTDTNI